MYNAYIFLRGTEVIAILVELFGSLWILFGLLHALLHGTQGLHCFYRITYNITRLRAISLKRRKVPKTDVINSLLLILYSINLNVICWYVALAY